MNIKGRLIKIEDYLTKKRSQELGNPMTLVAAICNCLKNENMEGLKGYPPEIVEIVMQGSEKNHERDQGE